MNTIRILLICCVTVCGTATFTGCATAGRDSSSSYNPSAHSETRLVKGAPPAKDDDMNWVEKTGYTVGWAVLCLVYCYAQSNPGTPPWQ